MVAKKLSNTTQNSAKTVSKKMPSKIAQQEMAARRRLEDKLEAKRLSRELSEFDFE